MIMQLNIDINASIEHVFSFLEDEDKIKLWMKGLEEIKVIDENNPQKPFIAKIREGRKVNSYNGYTPYVNKPNALTVVMYNHLFEVETKYILKNLGENKVSLQYICTLTPKTIMFKILLFLFLPFSKVTAKSFLKSLKKVAQQ